ncbi:MAG: hypothetical protein Q4A36_00020 [Candidatus Saccharibacteria bacterium]|nr:hypothetical protein [Candidatus Saccharibacteria bacterium]
MEGIPKNQENINENSNNGAETLSEMPSFEEHIKSFDVADDNGSHPDIIEERSDKERTPEERQVDDLEVLFSFCDEKDVLKILRSDDYGVLLKNNVSLVDLFNANALFDEQYYGDGYTKDEWRREGDLYNVFDLMGIAGDKFSGDKMSKIRRKQYDRNYHIKERYTSEGWVNASSFYNDGERANEEHLDDYYLGPDKVRAAQTKETIAIIANSYFGENASPESADELKQIISLRAEGKDLSDEQKDFLKDQMNIVTDRLLYDGHVINEKRARDIMGGLDYAINRYNEDINSEAGERNKNIYRGTLVSNMAYAGKAIDDFLKAGKPDLVYEAQQKLSEMADDYFDIMVSTRMLHVSDDVNRFDAIDDLVFRYSNPYRLVERAKEYNLCKKEFDWLNNDEYKIRDPDRIVNAIVKAYTNDGYTNTTIGLEISEMTKDLKEVGVNDEAILKNFDRLEPTDFLDANSFYDGKGARLIEAGIDKERLIDKVFSSWYRDVGPFDTQAYSYGDESPAEILERNGFDITDIAKTFAPDHISKGLKEFIEKGADAKELLKYMASYREIFEGNFTGKDGHYHRIWFDGVQKMMVWDNDHPEGRMVLKEGMYGNSVDYIAINLDTFAENGVTEEEIINALPNGKMAPAGMFIPKMLECRKFNAQKVMNLGYKKYIEYLDEMVKAGVYDKEIADSKSDPSKYYSTIVENMSGWEKENRDKYYKSLVEEE